jgi:hypothetical protein
MIYIPSIPDGVRVKNTDGVTLAVFSPPWWRVDRWLFWLWLRLSRRARGTVTFTYLAEDKGKTHLESVERRVYEVRA